MNEWTQFIGVTMLEEQMLSTENKKSVSVSHGPPKIPQTSLEFSLLKPTGHVMHQKFNLLKPTSHVMHQQFNLLKPTSHVMHQV